MPLEEVREVKKKASLLFENVVRVPPGLGLGSSLDGSTDGGGDLL
jgi:hypothetical protein